MIQYDLTITILLDTKDGITNGGMPWQNLLTIQLTIIANREFLDSQLLKTKQSLKLKLLIEMVTMK